MKAEVVSLKEKLKALKSTTSKDGKVQALMEEIGETEKSVRESLSKAASIEAGVFDLKAVNPNAVVKVHTRTPTEIIQNIDKQGKIVTESLNTLRNLLK